MLFISLWMPCKGVLLSLYFSNILLGKQIDSIIDLLGINTSYFSGAVVIRQCSKSRQVLVGQRRGAWLITANESAAQADFNLAVGPTTQADFQDTVFRRCLTILGQVKAVVVLQLQQLLQPAFEDNERLQLPKEILEQFYPIECSFPQFIVSPASLYDSSI